MRLKIIITVLFSILAFNAFAADTLFYIRDGATGTYATTQCDSWASDRACDQLPTVLSRGTTGATYYIADGNYTGKKFDATTAAIDGTKIITLKKATVADHGTETGWDNAYGDGQAVFQQPDVLTSTDYKMVFYIKTSYITIDGVVGSGSDPSTYGFKALQHPSYGDSDNVFPYQSGFEIVYIGGSNVTVSNVKILHLAAIGSGDIPCVDGSPYTCRSAGFDAYCVSNCAISSVEFGYLYAYGFKENITIYKGSDIQIHNSYFVDNVSGSSAHGQNLNLDTVTNVSIYNNMIVDSEGFCIALHENLGGDSTGVSIYNNIFTGSKTALGDGCISTMGGVTNAFLGLQVHHNTIDSIDCGGNFLAVGLLTDVASDRAYVYNNLFYNSSGISLSNAGGTSGGIIHDNNAYLNCTGTINSADETSPQRDDSTTTPFVDAASGDYSISTTWDAAQVSASQASLLNQGKDLSSPYDVDYLGNSRDSTPTIGAYEDSGTPDATAPALAEVTPVATPSVNQAPQYVFSSDEAGTVTYGGTCGAGTLSSAVVGNNTTQWTLGVGTYSNCTITVTDSAANASTPLAVTEFVITPTAGVPMAGGGGMSFSGSLP